MLRSKEEVNALENMADSNMSNKKIDETLGLLLTTTKWHLRKLRSAQSLKHGQAAV